mmetsp:Transcript_10688/g.44203  ORF Transcript_10688/g.44203 Transcript_10688/m.44203 type:complete len:269 (-) Transcript_10688:1304-2110(-)
MARCRRYHRRRPQASRKRRLVARRAPKRGTRLVGGTGVSGRRRRSRTTQRALCPQGPRSVTTAARPDCAPQYFLHLSAARTRGQVGSEQEQWRRRGHAMSAREMRPCLRTGRVTTRTTTGVVLKNSRRAPPAHSPTIEVHCRRPRELSGKRMFSRMPLRWQRTAATTMSLRSTLKTRTAVSCVTSLSGRVPRLSWCRWSCSRRSRRTPAISRTCGTPRAPCSLARLLRAMSTASRSPQRINCYAREPSIAARNATTTTMCASCAFVQS